MFKSVIAPIKCHEFDVAQCEVINGSTLRFRRDRRELLYDILDLKIRFYLGQRKINQLPELIRKRNLEINGATEFSQSPKLYDSCKLFIPFEKKILRETHKLVLETLMPNSTLPSITRIEGISIDQFRTFWAAITTLSHSIFSAHIIFVRNNQDNNSQYMTTPVWVGKASDLICQLHQISEDLEDQTIQKLISFYEYIYTRPNADPALHPFIPFEDGKIIFAPSINVFNAHERNLMAIMAKYYALEYSVLSSDLESKNIDLICEQANNKSYFSRSNIKLPRKLRLPDVDFAIYDRSSNILLVAECKVSYGVAEIWEIENRRKSELKACKQIEAIKAYALSNRQVFLERVFQEVEYDDNVRIEFIVIFKDFVGTVSSEKLGVVVADQDLFIETLSMHDLEFTVNWFMSRKFMPIEGVDFNFVEDPIQCGPYKILWESFEPLFLK